MEEIVYEDVSYKGERGTLTVNDKVFHYQAHNTKTSVKCSWARVEKRQLSPETAKSHMIKLILVSGKNAVFTVHDRATLEEMRNDMQTRMDAARARQDDTSRSTMSDFTKSQRMSEDRMDASRASQTRASARGVAWQDEPIKPKKRSTTTRTTTTRASTNSTNTQQEETKRGDPCGWCLCGTLICWLITCCLCILIAIAIALIYWFVLKDSDEVNSVLNDVGIKDSDKSLPPDHGLEERYGIRAVNHEWDSEQVTLSYQLSDYIMDDSVSYILYDGIECRTSATDITRTNVYLFMDFSKPQDSKPNLSNKGTGTRGPFELTFSLNVGQLSDAPFFTPVGLDKAQLNFCVGLSIDYNKVEYWDEEKEVRKKRI